MAPASALELTTLFAVIRTFPDQTPSGTLFSSNPKSAGTGGGGLRGRIICPGTLIGSLMFGEYCQLELKIREKFITQKGEKGRESSPRKQSNEAWQPAQWFAICVDKDAKRPEEVEPIKPSCIEIRPCFLQKSSSAKVKIKPNCTIHACP